MLDPEGAACRSHRFSPDSAARRRRQAWTRGYLKGMHALAGIGVAFWIIGAVLVFAVGGGLWSDVPGGALIALGVAVELVATLVIAGRRFSRDC